LSLQPIDMLRRLAAGVTPDGKRARRSNAPFETRSFADLLLESSRPVRASGRPVRTDQDVEIELDDDEMEKLALALDRAEAQFMGSLLAISSSGVLIVDVAERTIRSADDAPGDELVTGIDGAVVLGGLGDDSAGDREVAEAVARGLRTLGNASPVRLIASGATG